MATCSYAQIVGGTCGPSVANPAHVQCVLIRKCDKDIRGHLKSIGVRDSSLDEARLLLARAGQCIHSFLFRSKILRKIIEKILNATVTVNHSFTVADRAKV